MAEKTYLFKHRTDGLGRFLAKLGLAPNYKHIPIFGIQGAGKSYFIMSMGYFISYRNLGRVVGESADYIMQFIPVMLRGERLDATPGYRDLDLKVDRVYQSDHDTLYDALDQYDALVLGLRREEKISEEDVGSETRPANYLLSTNDLSGTQFKDAMERLSEPSAKLGGDAQTQRFLEVLEGGDGAIVVVDIVRREMSPEQFAFDRNNIIRRALAEQVVPLVRGIQLSLLRGNRRNKIFPLFLVFPKRDIHQLSRQQLKTIINEVFALLLANLDERVVIRIHSVQNLGFGVDTESYLALERKTEGIGLFIADVCFWI